MCLHNFSTVFFLFDVAKATDEIDRRSMSTEAQCLSVQVVAHVAKANNEKF